MKIVIPARMGSKGFPLKNRKLFKYTAKIIPKEYREHVIVFTDDPEIKKMAKKHKFEIVTRPRSVSMDKTSTKETMKYLIDHLKLSDTVIMLYLTYPYRKWEDVMRAFFLYKDGAAGSSLLCKKEINWTPFLVLKEEPKNKGSQLFKHDLYRRQDYPKCFELSHYVCIFHSKDINKLNNNLYNKDTFYMEIPKETLDVDYEKDLKNS